MNIAQGELLFRPVSEIPDGCREMATENGMYIVGHSETGHHHVLERDNVEVFHGPEDQNPEGMQILYAIVRDVAELKHLRSHDTHETIALQPGMYEIRPAREFSPEGWRRVED